MVSPGIPPPPPPAPKRSRSSTQLAMLVVGVLLAIVGLPTAAAGGFLMWLDRGASDRDGYLATPAGTLESSGHAVTSERLKLAEAGTAGPDWGADLFGTLLLRGRSDDPARPVFIGIARERDARRYLAGVPHHRLTGFLNGEAQYHRRRGREKPDPPERERIWAARASGTGTRSLEWRIPEGSWTIVVMNADGARRVRARMSVGADLPWLGWLSPAVLGSGLLFLAVAAGLVILGLRPRRSAGE